jgi:predicted nucleic acid-binding protein
LVLTKNISGILDVESGLTRYGVIVALLDRSEKFHQSCAAILHDLRTLLVTCEAVIAESCYILRRLPGAAETVLENVEAAIFQIPYQLSQDTVATKQCFRKDRDRRIDLADPCLIRLADQLETPTS